MSRFFTLLLPLVVLTFSTVCGENEEVKGKPSAEKAEKVEKVEKKEVEMKLTSTIFKEGEMIPEKYTCDSADVSPQLAVTDIPEGTKSLAMICDDPDAPVGTWVHWVIFNIPADLTEFPEGISRDVNPVIGTDSTRTATQGINDFRRFGYGGPCPPPGSAHRYFFKLYALDMELEFDAAAIKKGVTAKQLSEKMKDHILAETSMMGKYKK